MSKLITIAEIFRKTLANHYFNVVPFAPQTQRHNRKNKKKL